MEVRHLFFDLDNTLWDHRKNAESAIAHLYELKKVTDQYGLSFSSFYDKYYEINETLWADIRDGKITRQYLSDHRFYDTFAAFGIEDADLSHYFEDHFFEELMHHQELVPGALDILEYLKKEDYQLHVVSNGFYEYTHNKVLKSGIQPYFGTVTSADSVGVRKPDPRIFQQALDDAGAQKPESAFIGDDWIADAIGSRDFGFKEVVFYDALHENLHEEGIRSISKLQELKEIF